MSDPPPPAAGRAQPVIGALPDACALDARSTVGRAYDPAMGEALLKRSGLRSVRIVRPGMQTTQELDEGRLTIVVDGAGRIVRVRCG